MNLQSTAQSPTLAMHNLASMREAEGQEVVKLGFGQSPFGPPDMVVKALQEYASRHDYAPVAGFPALREAVAGYHQKHDGLSCTADDILISAGSKALLYAVMAAFKTASVIIPQPSWVSYGPQADLLGHEKVALGRYSEKGWRITPEDLEEAVAKCTSGGEKILIINSPGNPDGIAYSEDEFSALADVARKHDVLVLSDEIYGRLNFEDAHVSFAKFYPEKTVVTTGLSKWCGAGGWRLGTAMVPENLKALRQTMIGILSEIVSCAPTPVQLAAIKAFEDSDEMLETLDKRRKILQAIGLYTHRKLVDAGIGCTEPQGGFYCFVDFMPMKDALAKRNLTTADEVCQALLQDTGVALLAGSAFGVDPSYMSARLAFVDFDGEAALDAAKTEAIDDAFIQKYCKKTYDGIQYIADWLAEQS